jgi:hypothetical protein
MKKYINKYFSIFSSNASENSINSEKNNEFIGNNYENGNSIATSFVVNNSVINNKYNIYGKNYNKIKNNIENFEDANSMQFFNDGINEEEKFFYDNDNYCDKSSKTLTFTDINLNNIENNHNNNLLNSSLTDSSSILDIKKFLNPNTSEKMEDDLDIGSFLFEDNNKNYFKYGNNGDKIYERSEVKENEEEKVKKNNNNKNSNNNYIYRIGSFYPKLNNNDNNSEKKSSTNIIKEFNDEIDFNIFEYLFCRCISKKKRNIELYKLGIILYKKRMDIINVFTLLLFSEKNCLKYEDLN